MTDLNQYGKGIAQAVEKWVKEVYGTYQQYFYAKEQAMPQLYRGFDDEEIRLAEPNLDQPELDEEELDEEEEEEDEDFFEDDEEEDLDEDDDEDDDWGLEDEPVPDAN